MNLKSNHNHEISLNLATGQTILETHFQNIINRLKKISFISDTERERKRNTFRTEAKLSACSISEKWRFHRFQSHSKEELVLVLLLLLPLEQRKLEFLRVLLLKEAFLVWTEQPQLQPTTKLRWVFDFTDEKCEKHKLGLSWGIGIPCPTPHVLATDISLSLSNVCESVTVSVFFKIGGVLEYLNLWKKWCFGL